MKELLIENLHVEVENKEILKGIDLTLKPGQTLAILGPNGHGKSTLFNALMGNPKYKITQGKIILDGEDITNLSVDERSKKGLFLAMQNPCEVPGVINAEFLRSALNDKKKKPVSLYQFYKLLDNATKKLNMPFDLANRNLNEGFSGGEKKRNEILQMLILNPDICMLDEIDSGLDVDALKIVSEAIHDCQKETGAGLLVVSHYARFYEYLNPTHAHVLIDGKIVVSGGKELIEKIDSQGYEWLEKEYQVSARKQEQTSRPSSIGLCGAKR